MTPNPERHNHRKFTEVTREPLNKYMTTLTYSQFHARHRVVALFAMGAGHCLHRMPRGDARQTPAEWLYT